MIIKGRHRTDTGFLRLYLLPGATGDFHPEAGSRRPAVKMLPKKNRVRESVHELRGTLLRLLASGVSLEEATAALTAVLVQVVAQDKGVSKELRLNIEADVEAAERLVYPANRHARRKKTGRTKARKLRK